MSTILRACLACLVGVVGTTSAACGGRTQLVPAYQIGRLSADAVVANGSGVRVVVRTAAWPDPQVTFRRVQPLEITFDNMSPHPLSIHPRHITLVTETGRRISSVPSAALELMSGDRGDPEFRLPIRQMTDRALAEGVLPRDDRQNGFVYFATPDDSEQLNLEIDLVAADSGAQFGTIIIPFLIG